VLSAVIFRIATCFTSLRQGRMRVVLATGIILLALIAAGAGAIFAASPRAGEPANVTVLETAATRHLGAALAAAATQHRETAPPQAARSDHRRSASKCKLGAWWTVAGKCGARLAALRRRHRFFL
jgi:hypothetical protein